MEIGDDYIRWTTKSVEPTQGDLISRVLQPYPAGASFLVAAWILWDQKVSRLKRHLGLSALSRKESHSQPADLSPPHNHESSKIIPEGTWEGEKRSSGPLKSNVPETERAVGYSSTPSSTLQPVDSLETESISDLALASSAFVYTLTQLQPKNQTPPRGVFFIHGLVRLGGPSGFCNIYATALYDPSRGNWTNIFLGLKALIPYKQRPRGGR